MNERAAVAEAVWSQDPIGIAHSRDEAATEYDEAIDGLLALHRRGAGSVEMERWIHSFFADGWGIEYSENSARDLVGVVLLEMSRN